MTRAFRATLDWTPHFDNLDTIAMHALAWEEKLISDRAAGRREAVSA